LRRNRIRIGAISATWAITGYQLHWIEHRWTTHWINVDVVCFKSFMHFECVFETRCV
jgi:hypothetical protein